VSTLEEMGEDSTFHRVLWDDAEYLPGTTVKLVKDEKIRRVVMCSGKVYYDLLRRAREARHQRHLPAAAGAALPVPGQGADQRADALQATPRSSGARKSRRTWGRGRSSSPIWSGCWRISRPSTSRPLCRPFGFGLDGDRPDVRHLAGTFSIAFLEDALGRLSRPENGD
jgi:hypothetical protein